MGNKERRREEHPAVFFSVFTPRCHDVHWVAVGGRVLCAAMRDGLSETEDVRPHAEYPGGGALPSRLYIRWYGVGNRQSQEINLQPMPARDTSVLHIIGLIFVRD